MRSSYRFWAPFLLFVGLVVGFWMPRDDTFFLIKKNFTIFAELYEHIATGYVDQIDPEKLMRTGIEAMLRTLDPYTTFYDEADNEDIDIMTQGAYGGIGISVSQLQGRMMVVDVMEGYDAQKQGLRVGDELVAVDSTSLKGLDTDAVSALLRGDPGSRVTVTVRREGVPEPLVLTITRTRIRLPNVTYAGYLDEEAGVGYIRLERFAQQATDEVRDAIETLQKEGHLQRLVLDLRGNPGGLLNEAVALAGLFLPEGSLIVSTRGRLPESVQEYRSRRPPMLPDMPLAILVDSRSASASEIVAGAVQDMDRGVIIGERTFGKGLVQIIRRLPYHTALKMTTARYYTPSGRCIQAITYTHRAEDGYAVTVADSLRRTFYTEGGRPVRDGGGIEPDISVSDGERSELERVLREKAAFFFYANHFVATHSEPTEVDDAVLQNFRHWLEQQHFTYNTALDRTYQTLQAQAAEYAYDLDTPLKELEKALEQEKARDFKRHAERLKRVLQREIMRRYLTHDEMQRMLLAEDPVVARAVRVLKDARVYTSLTAAPARQ